MVALHLLKLEGAIDPAMAAGLQRAGARLYRATQGTTTYAYVEGASLDLPALHLMPTLSIEGASSGQPAPFRYVVETDVQPGREDDFNAWYAQEHLPGLAAVPGTVQARQYLVDGPGPRYHSVYDLTSVETFDSPPWLAVRGTAWSDRIRPTFRNTLRTMFRAV